MQQQAERPATTFRDLGLSARTLDSINKMGFKKPSPIQAALLPVALTGQDCTGQARTGTGKTAAFVIPILERIDIGDTRTQALVLTPTRELSEQVAEEARKLGQCSPCQTVCLVGGRPIRKQIMDLQRGAQIAVGTPGRVIDLVSRRVLSLSDLKIVVLDEADRMLDIGFRPDIEKILRQCPVDRQTLLLSATMPPPVERLAKRYMRDAERVDLSSDGVAVDSVTQYFITVDSDRKFGLLTRLLVRERPQQVLVFTRTKRGADELQRRFAGRLPDVDHLHGDLPQTKRDKVMKRFREGRVRMLIATDVVGRGIDVSSVSHIINYDIPEFCDDYVHRIGRTGRLSSDKMGNAFTFVTCEQGSQLTNIEQRINRELKEYRIDGYEAYRPRAPQKHVDKAAEEMYSYA